ncbi:MAG: hypothetical protein GC186_20725 [Rhodobacteraceae bacterium]|nr:hypothetical protein [Paracoccaceae bacterium]
MLGFNDPRRTTTTGRIVDEDLAKRRRPLPLALFRLVLRPRRRASHNGMASAGDNAYGATPQPGGSTSALLGKIQVEMIGEAPVVPLNQQQRG